MSTQVVAKREPRDKVGNVVSVDGRLRIIGYSDLPDDAAEFPPARWFAAVLGWQHGGPPVRTLVLGTHPVAHRGITVSSLVRKSRFELEGSRRGQPREPAEPERDQVRTLRLRSAARGTQCHRDASRTRAANSRRSRMARRAAHDTPETVRAAMIALHTEWLKQAGADVATGMPVEISPLWALDAEIKGQDRRAAENYRADVSRLALPTLLLGLRAIGSVSARLDSCLDRSGTKNTGKASGSLNSGRHKAPDRPS